jgi:hypothetical protein
MNRFLRLFLLVACSIAWIAASPQPSKKTSKADVPVHEAKATIEGLVRDIACPIQNLEATATHLSMKCLLECARSGSPLVILTKHGELYLPISGAMPDTDQRPIGVEAHVKFCLAIGNQDERRRKTTAQSRFRNQERRSQGDDSQRNGSEEVSRPE